MLKIKNIARRIERIEEHIKATEPITIVFCFYDTIKNIYSINAPSITNGFIECSDYDKFIKEHNINLNSDKTYIYTLNVAPNRTYDDVMNS